MKILIVRFSSIGDIVLTTPVPRCVKTQLENAEVHYATKEQYRSILENNPYVDKVFLLKDSLDELFVELKKENYDYVLDLHNNLRTRILKWKLGAHSFSFNKLNIEKWLMVNFKINKLPDVHIVDRYLATAKPLGVKNDALGLDYFIPEKDEVPWEWFPETHRAGYVAYAIGAQHETKKLPVERIVELCKKISRPIVLLGGKEDFENGEKVKLELERKNPSIPIFNTCGKFNLNQSADIVKKSAVVFSHDTGLMHIAAALKKEVYSIWGNTIPAFGMYPYRTSYHSLENKDLDCRPCSKIGYQKCPKGHFKCMRELPFDFELK
ncbi:MAG TPA: glycosyltransferase family 9 protein [Cyclobacteriaceae bacterium]|nr:glycosyltransferase family 9 protein [Cyclobacteriaceae bacterium]